MGTRAQKLHQPGNEALLLTSEKTAPRKSLIWNPDRVLVILKHGPGCSNRALLAAKFEEAVLPMPGRPGLTQELSRYPWASAKAADQPLLARCTEASAISQYCVLSPVLTLVIMGKGTSAGGSPAQIICLSSGRTQDAQNVLLSPQLYAVGGQSATTVTVLLPSGIHFPSHCYQVMCQHFWSWKRCPRT